MINKYAVLFGLAVLMSGAAMGIRSVAQSAAAASTRPTNGISPYFQAAQQALVSGTEATNLTDVELRSLMNESIKTNLAAQLWFRESLGGRLSDQGAKMATEIRVLESLRGGHTNDAIRQLEQGLDSDIVLLATDLRAADKIKAYNPTPQSLKALRWAKDYRMKFPHTSGDPATDERVAHGLSYLDQK